MEMYSPHLPYDPTWSRSQFSEWLKSYAETPDHDIVFMGIAMIGHYPPEYIWECKGAAHNMLRGIRCPPLVEQAVMYFACPRLQHAIRAANQQQFAATHQQQFH